MTNPFIKINPYDTHDRLKHLISDQALIVAEGAEECLKKNELSLQLQEKSPYIYIFAHARTHDDGIRKRLLWQPRLTKPQAQTNSFLFRAISKTDIIHICWLIPPPELWTQYEKGKVTENETAMWCIDQFKNNRKELEAKDPEDLPEARIKQIYLDIKRGMKQPKKIIGLK